RCLRGRWSDQEVVIVLVPAFNSPQAEHRHSPYLGSGAIERVGQSLADLLFDCSRERWTGNSINQDARGVAQAQDPFVLAGSVLNLVGGELSAAREDRGQYRRQLLVVYYSDAKEFLD